MAELTAASKRLLNNNLVYSGYTVNVKTIAAYIVEAAGRHNIDPNVALAVYSSEGLTGWQSKVFSNGNQERSWGPYQLNTTGGLGNDFQRATGLDATNPNNWRQNVDYALNYAATNPNGWKPWNGFKTTIYFSQGYKAGIGPNAATQPISPNGTVKPNGNIPGATAQRELTDDEKKLALDPGAPTDAAGILNKNWYQNDETGELYYNPFREKEPTRIEIVGGGLSASYDREQIPRPNLLHDYESYTYNLSLHAISTGAYTDLVKQDDPTKSLSRKVLRDNLVIVAGAGRKDYPRDRVEDFFFDNLRIDTVINTTERSGNTNAYALNFTIVEPNGFTLFDRLIDAVASLGGASWINHPFVLEIAFFGYKDGAPDTTLQDHTKYIPIKLIDIKSRNSHKGTEYTVTASPFNHQAFGEVYVTTPSLLSVKAQTVGDLLGTGKIDTNYSAALAALARETPTNTDPTATNTNNSTIAANSSLSNSIFQANGITDAINSWYNRIKQNGYTKFKIANVNVELPEEIRTAKLVTISPNTVQQSAPITPKNAGTNTAQQAAGLNKGGISFDGTSMSVPAGTRIDKLINYAIRNSSYVSNQLTKDPDSRTAPNGNRSQPLRWWRIIPRVTVDAYIPESNTYSLNITYVVKKWIKTTDYPYAPIGRQQGYVKEYNYMFTGGRSPVSGESQSNRDVIDLEILFNMLYFQPITVFKEKDQAASTAAGIYDKLQPGYDDTGLSRQPRNENKFLSYNYGKLGPPSKNYIARDLQLQNKNSPQSQSSATAADLEKSLMVGARGDMIEVKLKIIGDPSFIKQDDILYGQYNTGSASELTPNGSLSTDNGELYVYLNFRSPTDYKQSTGLANPRDSQYVFASGIYSGIYKIITVDSTFNKGKFEQTLTLVKTLITDESRDSDFNTVGQRYNTFTNGGFPQVPAALPSRFGGPNIVRAGTAGLEVGMSSVLNAAGGGGSALVSGLLGQVQSLAVGAVKNLVTKELNAVVSKGVAELKSFINGPTAGLEGGQVSLASADQSGVGAGTYQTDDLPAGYEYEGTGGLDGGQESLASADQSGVGSGSFYNEDLYGDAANGMTESASQLTEGATEVVADAGEAIVVAGEETVEAIASFFA